jgi:hypothetical protein
MQWARCRRTFCEIPTPKFIWIIKPFIIISTFRRHNAATVFDRTNGFFLDRFAVVGEEQPRLWRDIGFGAGEVIVFASFAGVDRGFLAN